MGRSSRKQAEENRLRIVKAAAGLFLSRGIEPVGIADVMKAAGMTQGGFYRHFSSKEGLATEACSFAFEKAVEIWKRVANEAAERKQDPIEALVAFYLSPKPAIMTCPMVAFSTDAALRGADDPLRDVYDNGVSTLFDTFAEIAGRRGSAGAAPDLRATFAAMIGSNVLARSSHDPRWSKALDRTASKASDKKPR